MSSYTLQFADPSSSSFSSSIISYSLVELPPVLLAKDTSATSSSKDASSNNDDDILSNLVIKGQPNDDAVLCTKTSTYTLRAVKNSNSLLLCRPVGAAAASKESNGDVKGKGKRVEIEDTLHQTLELELAVPKLDKIAELLKGSEWSVEGAQEEARASKKRKRNNGLSREDILDLVPASDAQIEAALHDRRILDIDGQCRPLSPGTLTTLLKLILQTLVLLSLSPLSFPLSDLSESLEKDDSVPSGVTRQVVSWFGKRRKTGEEEDWELRLDQVAKEVGKELLASHKNKPVPQDRFMDEWREAMGEQFSPHCELSLLSGFYLLTPSKSINNPSPTLTYFPISSLPLDPASRFSELFSVQQRWRTDAIQPFLVDLAVDGKKRDALTLKFTRKVKGEDGKNYYAARGR